MFNPLILILRAGTLFLLFITLSVHGMQLPPAARYWHGSVFGELYRDAVSSGANPALLATSKGGVAAFTTQPFGMAGIPLYTAAVVFPAGNTGVGLQVMQFGNAYWRQQDISGGMGIGLGELLQAGVQFGYRSKSVVQYGSSGQIMAGAGFRWKPTKQWTSAVQVIKGDYIQYFAGLGWQPTDDFLFSVEGSNTKDKKYYGTVQVLSRLVPALALQLAVTGLPAYLQTLVLITVRQLRIDVGAALHQQLGLTPSITLVWQKQ
ncbi:hypothetical protein SAMN05444266_106282 [Chitinophaga jiangningensis]|uniref:Type IX secretion system membrane protein, PorP/SprF family n=1 Tax=Chitinophaga jiangningensis TaxID=1419482 RepID=A0A1M7FVC9_9BACT|nr:hypothetical protein [Chitinophaga jiangningensis]SHM07748.1 hypothetical protein SAMN05444266_106282 [Chitinophaga jiangningensis]